MIRSSNICFTSRYSVGVTFLIWSYYWLAGYDRHYHARLQTLIDLVNDPNTEINAHNFRKNCHVGSTAWQSAMDLYDQLDLDDPVCWYGDALASGDIEHINKDYAAAVSASSSRVPTVFVVESEQDPFYFVKLRGFTSPLHEYDVSQAEYSQTKVTDLIDHFFSCSSQKFDQNIWDRRELLALNYRSLLKDRRYLDHIDYSKSLYRVDSRQLWFDGEQLLLSLFHWLGQSIDLSRLEHWRNVYRNWQQLQMDVLNFGWNLPHIVSCIVHGYRYDLTRFRLDLHREAVIQGLLIEQYGLNLRTWGLQRFPDDALDLHHLLEKSHHPQ